MARPKCDTPPCLLSEIALFLWFLFFNEFKPTKKEEEKGLCCLNFPPISVMILHVFWMNLMRVWWRLRCKSSDQLDFSLQSEREGQIELWAREAAAAGLHWRRWSQCKETEDWEGIVEDMLLSIWVHPCIFSQDLGCWDRFACEYLTTILHHFGSVNAWILQLPTAFVDPPLVCDVGPVDFGFCCLCCRWQKWLLRKTGERARLEEEVGSSLTCLHCFLVLPIALRLQNLWWVSLQGPSCWVILDVVYIVYIYIYMLMQTILVVWCS